VAQPPSAVFLSPLCAPSCPLWLKVFGNYPPLVILAIFLQPSACTFSRAPRPYSLCRPNSTQGHPRPPKAEKIGRGSQTQKQETQRDFRCALFRQAAWQMHVSRFLPRSHRRNSSPAPVMSFAALCLTQVHIFSTRQGQLTAYPSQHQTPLLICAYLRKSAATILTRFSPPAHHTRWPCSTYRSTHDPAQAVSPAPAHSIAPCWLRWQSAQ